MILFIQWHYLPCKEGVSSILFRLLLLRHLFCYKCWYHMNINEAPTSGFPSIHAYQAHFQLTFCTVIWMISLNYHVFQCSIPYNQCDVTQDTLVSGFQADPKDSKTNSKQLLLLKSLPRVKWKQGLTALPASTQARLNFEKTLKISFCCL